MADNIAITAGSGTTIRTDEVSDAHYQVVKLATGADGTAVMVAHGQTTKSASIPVTVASDDNVVTLLTAIDGRVDGVETLIGTTNSTLTTIDGRVDGLESLTTAMSAKLPAALGQTTMSASMSVALASNQSTVPVGQVSSAYDVSTSFTRPSDTTAYAANDIVGATAAALTFSTVGPSAGSILITGADLEIDINAIPSGMTGFKLHLYSVTPPSAAADNAAMNVPSGDRASWLGCIDLDPPVDYGDTIGSKTTNINAQIKLAGTNLYGYLVTNGGFTPTSAAVHKITLHTMAV